MQLLRKHLPIAVAFIMGVLLFFQFYIPTRASSTFLENVTQWDRIIAGFALLLGIYSLLNHHFHKLRRRVPGWGFSVIVYAGFFAMMLAGFIWGIRNDPPISFTPLISGLVAGADDAVQYEQFVTSGLEAVPPEEVSPTVQSLYEVIEGLVPNDAVLFVVDYGQTDEADLYPITLVLLRQCFRKELRVLGVSLVEEGEPFLEQALSTVAPEFDAQYGADYVNLGFKEGNEQVIVSAGRSLTDAFPTDFEGTPTSGMTVLEDLESLRDLNYLIEVAGGTEIDPWINWWITNDGSAMYRISIGLTTLADLDPAYRPSYGEPYQVQESKPFMWMYDNLFVPMQATMFSILAFYIASAAYRAFRARTKEATVLLITAILVMLGRVPLGTLLIRYWSDGHWVPVMGLSGDQEFLSWFTEWILNVPSMAAQRGIMIGIGLGMISTALRIIFGIERTYMGGGD